MTLLCSIRQAARELRRDRAFLARRLLALGIQPAGTRAGHPVYRLRDLVRASGRTLFGEPDPEGMTPFERHAHYKAENLIDGINRARGDLVRREDADAAWARVRSVITFHLDTVVDEIARDVRPGQAILDKISSKVAGMRELLLLEGASA